MEDYEKYMQEFYAILAQTGTQNIFIVFGDLMASKIIREYSGKNKKGSYKIQREIMDKAVSEACDYFTEDNHAKIGCYIASVVYLSQSYGFCQ